MTRKRMQKIFDTAESEWDGDNALQGALIIAKYIDSTKSDILCGADNGIIYSVDVDDIIKVGITEEDVMKLAKLNWMIDEEFDCLAVFV